MAFHGPWIRPECYRASISLSKASKARMLTSKLSVAGRCRQGSRQVCSDALS